MGSRLCGFESKRTKDIFSQMKYFLICVSLLFVISVVLAKPSCGSCNGSCAGTCNLCAGCSSAAQSQIFTDQLDRERPNFLNINESQIAFPKDGTKIIFPKNET